MPALRSAFRLAIFAVALALASPALAHVDPLTGQDYRDFQRRDGKGACCDWHDCRPATAPYQTPGGMRIRDRAGNEFDFDPAKVVARPSDDGNWHLCGDGHRLKCIIAPAEARATVRGQTVAADVAEDRANAVR